MMYPPRPDSVSVDAPHVNVTVGAEYVAFGEVGVVGGVVSGAVTVIAFDQAL